MVPVGCKSRLEESHSSLFIMPGSQHRHDRDNCYVTTLNMPLSIISKDSCLQVGFSDMPHSTTHVHHQAPVIRKGCAGACRILQVSGSNTGWGSVMLTKLSVLTNSVEPSTTREATSCAAIRQFPAFYGTRRFITEFTRALHLYLS
jgi:hypothetical protein